MKDGLGSIRSDLQRQGGDAVAVAGERGDRLGCAEAWDRPQDLGAPSEGFAVDSRSRTDEHRGQPRPANGPRPLRRNARDLAGRQPLHQHCTAQGATEGRDEDRRLISPASFRARQFAQPDRHNEQDSGRIVQRFPYGPPRRIVEW